MSYLGKIGTTKTVHDCIKHDTPLQVHKKVQNQVVGFTKLD